MPSTLRAGRFAVFLSMRGSPGACNAETAVLTLSTSWLSHFFIPMLIFRQPEEVTRWWLAFHVKQGYWRYERLIPGRFSHVSAFAYLSGPKVWLLVENSPRTQSRIAIWPDASDDPTMPPQLAEWTTHCSILRAEVRQRQGFRLKIGFWCVTAVKDLLGSSSRALSPEGLWRDLIREGADLVYDASVSPATAPARSCARSAS